MNRSKKGGGLYDSTTVVSRSTFQFELEVPLCASSVTIEKKQGGGCRDINEVFILKPSCKMHD